MRVYRYDWLPKKEERKGRKGDQSSEGKEDRLSISVVSHISVNGIENIIGLCLFKS